MRNLIIGFIVVGTLLGMSGVRAQGTNDPCHGPGGGMIGGPLKGLRAVSIIVNVADETRQGSSAYLEQLRSRDFADQILVALRSKAPTLHYDATGPSEIGLTVLLAGTGPTWGGS
jgi:hypothetical protein